MNQPFDEPLRMAVIGDVHRFWDDEDNRYFDQSDYDLVLFVGDLAGYTHRGGLDVARRIARLQKPALVIPGNHDAVHALQLGSEVFDAASGLRERLGGRQTYRVEALRSALGNAELGGYSQHRFVFRGRPLNVVCARPHSVGGPRLAFARYLRAAFGVESIEDSATKIESLIVGCDDAPIVVLAHNGPNGLGAHGNDIWGADFREGLGDWGDPDLAFAIERARRAKKNVVTVIAGHMHLRTRAGKDRPPRVDRDGLLYINAARVPRHRIFDEVLKRHHVRLELDVEGNVETSEHWV
ncbi:MAG: metallophosphoesterase [Polyangiales bacterium]